MKGKKLYPVIGLIVGIIVIFIMWNSFSGPGVQDLKGDFKRVAFYKNENNTGPVERIYAVTVTDTLWDEMEKYGAFMPHTKYGNTKVYFFPEQSPVPDQLYAGKDNFEEGFKKFCIGKYEKDAMGNVSFLKKPF